MLRAKLRSLKRALFRRSSMEAGMADELQFHIESRSDDLVRSGMSREEALRQARLELGSAERYKEEMRQAVGFHFIDELRADIKYSARVLRKSPAFSFAAILTLALGITANSAVFSIINEVFIRKLPVGHPDELVHFDWLRVPDSMIAGYSGSGRPSGVGDLPAMTSFSFKTFEEIRDHNQTLSDVAAFKPMFDPINVVADNAPAIARGQLVSGNYFSVLQISAEAGRTILPQDDQDNAQPVAMISGRYWKERFDGSSSVIGKQIRINGLPFTVIGVTPEQFYGIELGKGADVWLPLTAKTNLNVERSTENWRWWVEMFGRIKPGATRAQVLADLQPIWEESVRDTFDLRPPRLRVPAFAQRTVIPPLRANDGSRGPITMRRHYTPLLLTFVFVVLLILMIVCANIANLLLARASSRRQELSVRLAIGAGRRRLIRQLLTESIALAMCGGLLGFVFTFWSRNFLSWLPESGNEGLAITPTIDWRVIAFGFGLSLLTGILFGVFPSIRATKSDLSPALRSNIQRGGSKLLVSKWLLTLQVAICLVLLVGAGLIVRSVRNLQTTDIGFNPQNLVLFDIKPELNKYDEVSGRQLYHRLTTAIEQVPGVESVTMTGIRPIMGGGTWFSITSGETADTREPLNAYVHNVGTKFFETMQIPLLLGRAITLADDKVEPRPAVINQALAKQLFKDVNPIGKQFKYADPGMQDHVSFEVVGLAKDARYHEIQSENPPTMYVPFSEDPERATFAIRTAITPAAAIAQIRQAVAKVDRELPLVDVTTQEDQIRTEIGQYRMFAAFSTSFGVFAVIMACIGLYGIVSYSVTRSINEIGIRMALGATRSDILRLVMSGIFNVTAVGLATGIGVALALTRFIASWLLYGVSAYDPLTIGGAILLISAVSGLSAYLPARRAARVDPMVALRYE
jgi:predicted permease